MDSRKQIETALLAAGMLSADLLSKRDVAAAAGKPIRTLDWDKAAAILKDRKAVNASAGLGEDWYYTAGTILKDGKPVPDREGAYLSSCWATPTLRIENDDGSYENVECACLESASPGWGCDTNWPQSALNIFNAPGA